MQIDGAVKASMGKIYKLDASRYSQQLSKAFMYTAKIAYLSLNVGLPCSLGQKNVATPGVRLPLFGGRVAQVRTNGE